MKNQNFPDPLSKWELSQCAKADSPFSVVSQFGSRVVLGAIRYLLENKHLYQSVDALDSEFLQEAVTHFVQANADEAYTSPRVAYVSSSASLGERIAWFRDTFSKHLLQPWAQTVGGSGGAVGLGFPKPVLLYCPTCDDKVAFAPVSSDLIVRWSSRQNDPIEQHFVVGYECQQCRGSDRERIVFTIVRRGTKITLWGRDPLELVPLEKHIPPGQKRFLSGALIASNAGQILPALFMLRTFIEQFWRSIPGVEQERLHALALGNRLPGDQLASLYNTILPTEMRDRFPSLGKVYSDVSAAIHNAEEGEKAYELFASSWSDINRHFDALRLFRASDNDLDHHLSVGGGQLSTANSVTDSQLGDTKNENGANQTLNED